VHFKIFLPSISALKQLKISTFFGEFKKHLYHAVILLSQALKWVIKMYNKCGKFRVFSGMTSFIASRLFWK